MSHWTVIDDVWVHTQFSVLIHSLINSFIPAISIAPLQVLCYSEVLSTAARILYWSFTRSAQATAGKGYSQGPYMAARAGVEPTTLSVVTKMRRSNESL